MTDSTTLVFTGDIGFDKYMDHMWEDADLLSPKVLEYLHSGDHVIANVEGPLVARDGAAATTGTQQLLHAMDPACTRVLDNMHADIWNICNNHIMDCGPDGIAATLAQAAAHHAHTIGAGMNIEQAAAPLILDEAGGIGLFGVGYQRACRKAEEDKAGCLSWSDLDRIQENITRIKQTCRWCIIVAHAGEEFTALPTTYTRDRYLQYLEMGADIVVAHHPHVPMNYETVGDKVIFYSLGNFIFDTDYQRSQYNTEKGLLVRLHLTPEHCDWDAMGLVINRESEHVEAGPLPRIFTDVQEEEYRLLEPLAAAMFLENTKRQQIYMNPDRFQSATEAEWDAHFHEPLRSGRVPGETLDFYIITEIAKRASEGTWRQSRLEDVKAYILEQM